jgi:SAM-dependent methyltransferase
MRMTLPQAVSGLYVSHIAEFLLRTDILDHLRRNLTVEEIARLNGYDVSTLRMLLEFVAVKCDLLERTSIGEFEIADTYADRARLNHLLSQYVGAYGPCLLSIEQIVANPSIGMALKNSKQHAAAFSGDEPDRRLVDIVEDLAFDYVVDLGCGGGQLLNSLAKERPSIRGVGIDINAMAIETAKNSAHASQLSRRITYLMGDFRKVLAALSPEQLTRVDAVVASNVLNEFFANPSGAEVVEVLTQLRRFFPGALLIVSDYYGRLGTPLSARPRWHPTITHDLAQVLSGQGVPPSGPDEWADIYARASCLQVGRIEGETDGIAWFVHLVRM